MNHSKNNSGNKTGVIHPGQMGVTIAAALASEGHVACWASQGRSAETVNRAEQSNLLDLVTLDALCSECDFLFSVCPPDQATAVAQQVADKGYGGIYIDCNAVSPATTAWVNKIVTQNGAKFVDGGIIGPPAVKSGTTRLYLSGESASVVAKMFSDSVVDARVLSSNTGDASALKMAYAGWTKGSAALLMTQFALAKKLNVESALLEEWELSQPALTAKLDSGCAGMAPKAWRFTGEMHEIADSLEDAGLSRFWFDGAADVYERLSGLKNKPAVEREEVINTLLQKLNES